MPQFVRGEEPLIQTKSACPVAISGCGLHNLFTMSGGKMNCT